MMIWLWGNGSLIYSKTNLLYYLPMERMTKGEWMTPEEYIAMVEEENKNMNEKVRFLEECLDNKEKVNKSLREENRKLKDEIQEWLNAVWNK